MGLIFNYQIYLVYYVKILIIFIVFVDIINNLFCNFIISTYKKLDAKSRNVPI